MVLGLETFKNYFAGYEEQYVLIGGAACDILFEHNAAEFRVTKDFDMVLIVEALTPDFGKLFWKFIEDGNYRNKMRSDGNPSFYRFDKPETANYPKMIELFGRSNFKLANMNHLTPVHIDDEVSSLSAILLDDAYYECLINGKNIVNGISVLRPEYLILFKGKAYLDLKEKRDSGIKVDSASIKKHKNDVLRLTSELVLNDIESLPESVFIDISNFVRCLERDPFDANLLKKYRQKSEDLVNRLKDVFKIN